MSFAIGDTVRLGDSRWFENDYANGHTGIIETGDVVLVIGNPKEILRRRTFVTMVLHKNTVGTIYLIDWVDEVVR